MDTQKERQRGGQGIEIKFTPDYKANEPIFWQVFKELSKNNNGLDSYYNLQERLTSTGKLDAGESVLMIEHMEKTGKIEKTGDYNVYRIGKPVTTKEDEMPADLQMKFHCLK
jgi:hypothetical protein